jgi:hypothetical protein
MVAMTDPVTLRTVSLDAPQYFRTTFLALASQRQLVEYVVLDIEPCGQTNGKLQLAEAQVGGTQLPGSRDVLGAGAACGAGFLMHAHLAWCVARVCAQAAACSRLEQLQGWHACSEVQSSCQGCCGAHAPSCCSGQTAAGAGALAHTPGVQVTFAALCPQVARSSDFGRNDTVFFCRTHLGHLLQPGDLALGYDLANANYVGLDFEKHEAKGGRVPDVILVRKSYEEKRRKKRVGGRG